MIDFGGNFLSLINPTNAQLGGLIMRFPSTKKSTIPNIVNSSQNIAVFSFTGWNYHVQLEAKKQA